MRIDRFQRALAISPTSLHTISVVVAVLWFFVGHGGTAPFADETGFWNLLPAAVRGEGIVSTALAALTTIITVYSLAELNMSQVLLRINSRAISFVFAALIVAASFLRAFQPGFVLMLLLLLSFFPLLSSYQQDVSAPQAYLSLLYVGAGVLIFPKLVWMVPIYVVSLFVLRAMNARSVCAAFLGLVTPIWLVGCVAYYFDRMPHFWSVMQQMYRFEWGGYDQLSAGQDMMCWLAFAMFLVSTVDFLWRAYLDKTRTRIILRLLALHGAAIFLLLLLQPLCCNVLLPPAILLTSILSGHYVANDDTPLTNVIVCMFMLFVLTLFVLGIWIL